MSGIIGGIKGAMKKKVVVGQGAGDTNWDNVILLLNGDNLVDRSKTPKTVTNVNSTSINSSIVKYGTGSMAFTSTTTGDGNLVTIPGSSLGALPQVFTIELWAYPSSSKSSHNDGVISLGSGFSSFGIAYGDVNGTNFNFRSSTNIGDSTSYALNTWHHLAVTRDSSNIMRFFVNGTLKGSYTDSRTFSSSEFIIGSYGNPVSYAFGGYIDDVRITSGVARYTATFTPPSSALPTSSASYHPQWVNRYTNTSDVFNISTSYTTSGSDYIVTDAYSVQWKILANFANTTPTRWGGVKYINVSNTSGANSITSLVNGNYANSDMATRIVPGTIYSDCVSANSHGGTNRCSWHTDSASDAYPNITTAVKNAIAANNATFLDGQTSSLSTNFCASMFFEPPAGTSEVLLNFGSYYGGNYPHSVFVVNKNTGALVGNPIVFSNQSTSAPTDLNGTTSRNVLFRHTAGYVYFVMEMHYTIAFSQFILYR